MSYVCNTILSVSILEPDGWLDRVNEAIEDAASGQRLVLMDGDGREDWYGGRKYWEATTAAAAFNYFDPDELIERLSDLPWKHPDEVQVIAMRQNDDTFQIWTLAANQKEQDDA